MDNVFLGCAVPRNPRKIENLAAVALASGRLRDQFYTPAASCGARATASIPFRVVQNGARPPLRNVFFVFLCDDGFVYRNVERRSLISLAGFGFHRAVVFFYRTAWISNVKSSAVFTSDSSGRSAIGGNADYLCTSG